MPQIHVKRLPKLTRNIRIGILLLPFLTIIQSIDQLISQYSNFILLITLLILTYVGHEYHFRIPSNPMENFKFIILQELRKVIVCLLSAYLVAVLICEAYYIVVHVYNVSYGDQIMFWFRVIATLSNMEAQIQLCQKKHRKHASD